MTPEQLKKQGGYAFPSAQHDFPGMTLRDYFAAKALAAMLHPDQLASTMKTLVENHEHDDDLPKVLAHSAYLFTDAMLAERAREQ